MQALSVIVFGGIFSFAIAVLIHYLYYLFEYEPSGSFEVTWFFAFLGYVIAAIMSYNREQREKEEED